MLNLDIIIRFKGREGLVLHHVKYNDSGRVRPLFYIMSVAEMFITYMWVDIPF